MECRDTKLLIEAYWDRLLPPEMVDRVERHLNTCAACRAEYGPVTQLLTNPEVVAVPAGLSARICGAIEDLPLPELVTADNSPRLRRWQALLRAPWAGALAACVTFAFLGWLSSRLPGGAVMPDGSRPIRSVATEEPHPLLALSWVQSMAVPGPGAPLAGLAQASALDSLIEPRGGSPANFVRSRLRIPDLPAGDANSVVSDLPIVAGALYAGYPR